MAKSSAAGFLETVGAACGHPVTLDTPIEELSLDSLEFIDLLQSINIRPDEAAKCATVGGLYRAAHVSG